MAKLILTNFFLGFSSWLPAFPFVLPWDDLLPSSIWFSTTILIPNTSKSIFSHEFSPVCKLCTFYSRGFFTVLSVLPKLDSVLPGTFILPLFSIFVYCVSLHVIVYSWKSHTLLDFFFPSNKCILLRSCLHCSRASLNSLPGFSLAFLKFRDLLKWSVISTYRIHFIPIIII